MKYFFFEFLGSVHFAICLIIAAILFVITGTFLESWTGSHQYAAALTYQHPAFLILLAFFFINILFSALRRRPFKQRHLPFLITHFGLLMIISGIAVKTVYGVQGVMPLMEGSGSHALIIPHTHAILLKTQDNQIACYPLRDKNAPFYLTRFAPNSKETFEYWVKGDQAIIQGLPPFPVYHWEKGTAVPISAKAHFTLQEPWNLVAIKTKNAAKAAQALYQQGLSAGKACLNYDPLKGFQNPYVQTDEVSISLQGSRALINDAGIDLTQTPTLAFIQDTTGDTHVFFFDSYGRVFAKVFKPDQLPSLAVYDKGFSGYAAVLEIPFYSQSRSEVEKLFLEKFQTMLQTADPLTLAPPLQLAYKTCTDTYSNCIIELFRFWRDPGKAKVPSLKWEGIDKRLFRGIAWATDFLQKGGKTADWPLVLPDPKDSPKVTHLIQQILSISPQLPFISYQKNDAALLKTYLLAYGISPATIHPDYDALEIVPEKVMIECPLTFMQKTLAPKQNMELNQPIATLQFDQGIAVTLSYDSSGMGLYRPTADKKHLVRFQPAIQEIPYHLRLRNARQISYANSQQALSYEADLLIDDKEMHLSMNHVYETWDGYRFYLSSISSPDETDVKTIQIVVNRDPAKYFLTYPGAILVSLGIVLLFWWRPKKT